MAEGLPSPIPEPERVPRQTPMILRIGKDELIYAINYHYQQVGCATNTPGTPNRIPEDAEVTIMVPGGGDWSSTALEVGFDSKAPQAIEIRWKE